MADSIGVEAKPPRILSSTHLSLHAKLKSMRSFVLEKQRGVNIGLHERENCTSALTLDFPFSSNNIDLFGSCHKWNWLENHLMKISV